MPKIKKYPPEEYINRKFNRLWIVKEVLPPAHSKDRVLVRCDCGGGKVLFLWDVIKEQVKSCGCLHKEVMASRNDGLHVSKTKEHKTWLAIKGRCGNERNINYKNYGGRGINMYKPWKNSFKEFFQHVGPAPSPKHSIDRIDNNKGYIPGNVRWAVRKVQDNNKTSSHMITYNGKTQSLTLWAEELGIPRSLLTARLQRGYTFEKAITAPKKGIKTLTYKGRSRTVAQWARKLNISKAVIHQRINLGWSVKDALVMPVQDNSKLITYKGVTKSLAEWSRSCGIRASTLQGRLARGLPVEKIFDTANLKKTKKQ